MEELNKEGLNEEVVEAEEVLEEAAQVIEEEIENLEPVSEAPCCCEKTAAKKKCCIGCLITSIIMYLSAIISIFVGVVNFNDFLSQLNMIKEQMGGTLEGITFTMIVGSMSTAIIPMFLFGLAFIGLGTILLSNSKRK